MRIRNDLLLSADELNSYCKIPIKDYEVLKEIEKVHTFSTTKYYASLIDFNAPDDPLKKIQLPMEFEHYECGEEDTSGERAFTKIRGLQHKYEKTALMLVSSECAMYCRYCFRKRMVGIKNDEVVDDINAAFDYVQSHQEIDNILFSGGDSLFLSTEAIENLLDRAFSIEHIRLVRFGSRIPVVYPQRISNDEKLIRILKQYGKGGKLHVVTQFNHPRELTEEAKKCIDLLRSCNIMVRNQSVLLKGVNDNPDVLAALFNGLVAFGVVPYYLYQCRPVKYVKAHFQLPLVKGIDIVEDAKKQLNGIAKSFRFILSSYSGKIEVIGYSHTKIYFKYNQAFDEKNIGRIFTIDKDDDVAWVSETMQKDWI